MFQGTLVQRDLIPKLTDVIIRLAFIAKPTSQGKETSEGVPHESRIHYSSTVKASLQGLYLANIVLLATISYF